MTELLRRSLSRPLQSAVPAATVFALLMTPPCLRAQATRLPDQNPIQVFHLTNVAQTNDASEILIALRNMVAPSDKMYLLTTTNDVVVSAPPDQMAEIGRLISELDKPKPIYRLTYTLTESDNGKRIGVQHFGLVVVTGQQALLKQGDKIPVLTGNYNQDSATQQTQFTYIDVGINIDATLDRFAGGLRLRSKVEQSSAAPPQSGSVPQDPIIRQTLLQGTSVVTIGKPQTVGSIDIVGSTRHIDIEVVAEPIP